MIQHDMNRLDSISLLKTQWQTERGTKSIATIQATLIPNPFHCANTLQWSTETASKRQVPLCYYTAKCKVLGSHVADKWWHQGFNWLLQMKTQMRKGRAVSKQQKPARGEALRCSPHAGRATGLLAGCASHGEEAESLRDAGVMSSSWRPKGHRIAKVSDGCPAEWGTKV